MKMSNLLFAMNMGPAVLAGIKLGIGNILPTEKEQHPELVELWKKYRLLDKEGNLTEDGARMYMNKDLIEYELKTLTQLGLHPEEKLVTPPGNYQLLRSGLRAFAEEHGEQLYKNLPLDRQNIGNDLVILDLGGGSGAFLEQVQTYWPRSRGYLLDKRKTTDRTLVIDLIEDNWSEIFGPADVILLNDVLHCFDKKEQEYIIGQCWQTLKRGEGWLCIGEHHHTLEFSWRMKAVDRYGCIPLEELKKLMAIDSQDPDFSHNFDTHYFAFFQSR